MTDWKMIFENIRVLISKLREWDHTLVMISLSKEYAVVNKIYMQYKELETLPILREEKRWTHIAKYCTCPNELELAVSCARLPGWDQFAALYKEVVPVKVEVVPNYELEKLQRGVRELLDEYDDPSLTHEIMTVFETFLY